MHERPVVVFAGGGSGGHLYPALAMADALRERRPDVRTVFVGAERGLERTVLPDAGVEHVLVPLRPWARRNPLANLGVVSALVRSLALTVELYQSLRPELVVLTGGYAAASAGVVAVARGVPLVLQEPNAWPGMVTRLLAPWARQIHVAYPEVEERLRTRGKVTHVSGHPLRAVYDYRPGEESEVRERLGLDPDRAVVMVTGGSQGSKAINEMLVAAVHGVRSGTLPTPERWQLLWATGSGHYEAVAAALEAASDAPWLSLVPYIQDVPRVLPSVELAIARSGAGSTSELALVGAPAILIPLPTSAENHQEHNARALEEAGAAVMMRESEASADGLWLRVDALMNDPSKRRSMSAAALRRARPGAAATIADHLITLLRPTPRRRPSRGAEA